MQRYTLVNSTKNTGLRGLPLPVLEYLLNLGGQFFEFTSPYGASPQFISHSWKAHAPDLCYEVTIFPVKRQYLVSEAEFYIGTPYNSSAFSAFTQIVAKTVVAKFDNVAFHIGS